MPNLDTTKTEWNLRLMFQSDDDPAIQETMGKIEQATSEFVNKWKERTDYLDDPNILAEALDGYELWRRNYSADGSVGYYFWLRSMQDQIDPNLKAKRGKVEDFALKMANSIQFFELAVAKIPESKRSEFLAHDKLRPYKHFLERLFAQGKYMLSDEVEKVLNLKQPVSRDNWVQMTSAFLSKAEREILAESGQKELKNFSELSSLMSSQKKETRDSAAVAFNEVLAKHVEVAEAELNSILKDKQINDQLRGFTRPDESRHINDDISTEVVDALVEVVSSRFDIPQKFYALKARLFGVPKLAYHERNVPYGNIDKKYPYAEAVELVHSVMAKLDSEFADIAKNFVEQGRIDAFPRKSKWGNAFCAYHLLTTPVYILLNHTDRLEDVRTLAHELGHGINDELIKKTQNALNMETPMSTAEVASTFMEDFVLKELAREADAEMRLALNMMKLNDEVSTIFRQIACYRLEQELHAQFREKGYLSKEDIGNIFQKHMAAYMGEAVEQTEGSQNWWVYWSHIRSYFYVYSYASGLLISKSLQSSVRQDHSFMSKVKAFLSAGSSESPRDIFQKMGIGISGREFWQQGLGEVDRLLQETESLAKDLDKM